MNDLQAPFDPTAYVSITGAQLLQLVSGLSPVANRGMIVISTDVAGVAQIPDAVGNTYLQTYIWIRVQAATASCYVWAPGSVNNGSGAGFMHWIPVSNSIAYGSIIGAMIAPATITADKVISLDYSQLTNIPANLPPTGAAGGALAGTYPNPTLSPNAIIDASVAAQGLTPTVVLKGSGTDQQMLRSKIGTPAQLEFFNCPSIIKNASGINSNAGNDDKVPMVTLGAGTDAGTWAMKSISDLLVNSIAGDTTLLLSKSTGAAIDTFVSTGYLASQVLAVSLALPMAQVANYNGLLPAGCTSRRFRIYLKCITIDGDFAVNDQLEISSVTCWTAVPAFIGNVAVINTGAQLYITSPSTVALYKACGRSGVQQTLNTAKWYLMMDVSI